MNLLIFLQTIIFFCVFSIQPGMAVECLDVNTVGDEVIDLPSDWMKHIKKSLLENQKDMFKQQFDYVFNAHVTIPYKASNLKFYQLVNRPNYLVVKNEDSTLPNYESLLILKVISTDPFKVVKVFSHKEESAATKLTEEGLSEMICDQTLECVEVNKRMKTAEKNAIDTAQAWATAYLNEAQVTLKALIKAKDQDKKFSALSDELKASISDQTLQALKSAQFNPPMQKSIGQSMDKALIREYCAEDAGAFMRTALSYQGQEREIYLQKCDYYQSSKDVVAKNSEKLLLAQKKDRCYQETRPGKDVFCNTSNKWKPVFENTVKRVEVFN